MLILQIAGGIILAHLAIRFWRQGIALAVAIVLIFGAWLWWRSVESGVPAAVNAWDDVLGFAVLLGLIVIVVALSHAIDERAKRHPDSRMAARLVRIRDAMTPSDWKHKKR